MYGNFMRNLQMGYMNSPFSPPVGSTQLPSTQANLGSILPLGRTMFGTPNYMGLFGQMGMQPSTAFTPPSMNQQPAAQQPTSTGSLEEQLVRLGLLHKRPTTSGMGLLGLLSGSQQYLTQAQYDDLMQSNLQGG